MFFLSSAALIEDYICFDRRKSSYKPAQVFIKPCENGLKPRFSAVWELEKAGYIYESFSCAETATRPQGRSEPWTGIIASRSPSLPWRPMPLMRTARRPLLPEWTAIWQSPLIWRSFWRRSPRSWNKRNRLLQMREVVFKCPAPSKSGYFYQNRTPRGASVGQNAVLLYSYG